MNLRELDVLVGLLCSTVELRFWTIRRVRRARGGHVGKVATVASETRERYQIKGGGIHKHKIGRKQW